MTTWLGRAFGLLVRGLDWLLFTVLMYLLSWLPQRWVAPLYARLFAPWCRAFVRALGVDLQLHQHYSGRLPEQYILIANHPSVLEDIGIPALFPVRSLAKAEVRDWWVIGRIGAAAGTLYVRREDDGSRPVAYRALLRCLRAGACVAIYPEGGCKGRRIYERFEPGAFALSQRLDLPLLPVFIYYPAQEDLEWVQGESLPEKIWHIFIARNHRAHLYVFDPVWPEPGQPVQDYAEAVRQSYLDWQRRFLE